MAATHNPFGAAAMLDSKEGKVTLYRLNKLAEDGIADISRLPYSIKVLLESVLRNTDGFQVNEEDVTRLANWNAKSPVEEELPFKPGRVVLQDFTGVPSVVDLASLRDAMKQLGGDPSKINPQVPCDLVIDHSVQVDSFASPDAITINVGKEFERNRERYELLKWGQQAFENFRVVPPSMGIVHQVNLEYLAQVVLTKGENGGQVAFPDSLVGTDSHTTMINGLGVVGWGVGGIEAEAVMLGQPIFMLTPKVTGFKLSGRLAEGATATDLVLTVTQMLRKLGVVGQFVEYYGEGMNSLTLADRATLANMSPEYGATMGFFPVDDVTLDYMRMTGRDDARIDLVERYCKEQGLWRDASIEPEFTQWIELDLSTVEPSLAGPKRPQDRIALSSMKSKWEEDLSGVFGKSGGDAERTVDVRNNGDSFALEHGAVVIAAITSCTNTSNPSVMLASGLVAKKAVEKGLKSKPWTKTSLAPGSRVVTDYLEKAGLTEPLNQLGFNLVGYGCTTCIGNSGPLPESISKAIQEGDLVACSVLSGNRNFEGRINPDVKANYLASPPLVVAYALAGTTDIDLHHDPLGTGSDGKPVYLKDIWPTVKEVREVVQRCVTPEQFRTQYRDVFAGDDEWKKIGVTGGDIYDWNAESTYIQNPPFFTNMQSEPSPVEPIADARVLVMVGDSVTTDHISPAGAIKADSPAGRYLQDKGVRPIEFNSYGSRRGNDRVMTRGTFANIRLRNQMAPGTEGGLTTYLPSGEVMSIFDAAMKYKDDGTSLIVLAGKEYGTGSSRDWAAKGTMLLGVRAVIAESYERIHRSNLVGMGVLPLQFQPGETRESLGLDGSEAYSFAGLDESLKPRQSITVTAKRNEGSPIKFTTICRIDTPVEIEYYRNGGILPTVLRKIHKG